MGARHEVSPDGMTLTVRVVSPDIEVTTRIERLPGRPWTPASIDKAITMCQERLENSAPQPGQSSTTRRLRLPGRRYLVIHLMGGPPTWRLPKASLKHRALKIGWLGRAVAVRAHHRPGE